jgi:hypothetical protein
MVRPDTCGTATRRRRYRARDGRPGSPLHSATYRAADVDRYTLIRRVTTAIEEQCVVPYIQDDVDTLVLPPRTPAAARAVPLPPVAAVLTTAVYLLYIGRDARANDVLWTMHHYWTDQEADALDLTDWQQDISRADPDDGHTKIGLSYLGTWVSAILQSADDVIA